MTGSSCQQMASWHCVGFMQLSLQARHVVSGTLDTHFRHLVAPTPPVACVIEGFNVATARETNCAATP